ncbi:MAG: glycoside hydrolase family 26 protein [Clostridia bacterium]|nr:glycoside hydrolase family 26 protein [Clostridia bacterium]
MKKIAALLLGATMVFSCVLAGCGETSDNPPKDDDTGNPPVETPPSDTTDESVQTDRESLNYCFSGIYKKGELKDPANGFNSNEDIKGGRFRINNEFKTKYTEAGSRHDIKFELLNESKTRIVQASLGYTFTLPTTEYKTDYSISHYRTQYTFGDSILTTSINTQNPYTSNANPWYIYCGEWLINHVNNDTYLVNNGLERINGTLRYDFTMANAHGDLEFKPGYDVYRYDIHVTDNGGSTVDYPYYNIGIVRQETDASVFCLFVMKSKTDHKSDMDSMVKSYNRISTKGVRRAYYSAGTPKADPKWNEATTNYYNKLITSEKVHWGVFSYSMPGTESSLHAGQVGYDSGLSNAARMKDAIEEAWDYTYDIYPTYTHIGWGGGGPQSAGFQYHHFPLDMAKELAGGDGTNGKPVLQFTYQFTTNNNIVADEVTPMFDILRGKYDDYFHGLARDIKAYGGPVLFRLNNEMNTDWTSYCGMMTLLDPDVFNMTWIRLYKIFQEEGVDNCIWIWNPIANSCPYSSWGEDLCFFPGPDYVQLLGGTNYEMNNYAKGASGIKSFAECYSSLFQKNQSAFSEWVMILSEFACGSGGDYSGELGRNAATQAKWVKEMFDAFAAENMQPWAKSIKGAIWFNCNDYIGSGPSAQITNRLRFFDCDSNDYADLAETVAAFRDGFKRVNEKLSKEEN